jgi:hypothetical protein
MKLPNLTLHILGSIIDSSISVSSTEESCTIKEPPKKPQLSVPISNRHLSLGNTRELIEDTDVNDLS